MIDLTPKHLEMIQRILAEHIPECEIRAFGSRVKWTAKDYSDLDLAIVGSEPLSRRQLRQLKEAFEESDLPIRVDVADWQSLSDWFKKVIAAEYKVIQEAEPVGGLLKLRNISKAIVDCEHKTAPIEALGIPSIRTTDIKNGRIDLQNANKVSQETYHDWTKRMEPRPDDLILSREAPVGEVGIVPEDAKVCLGQRTVLIRPDCEKVVPRYLLYLLLTREMKHEMTSRAEGSIVPHLNMSDIRDLEIPVLPPLDEQRRVAHILGTLDDKIELNRQMNETLEAIAQTIFKSWFVDFDPVRAKMEGRMPAGMDAATATLFPSAFQDSPLGKIPEGWEVVSLPEAIEVNPRRVLKKGTTAPYLHMQNLPTQGHRPDNWTRREFNSGTKFINGDTLLARITPCIENGKTGFVDFLAEGEVGWGSTEYIVFRPKPPLPVEFGYYLARSNDLRTFAIHNMTGTTGRQRVPASCFDYYQFPVPTTPIAQQFSEIVQPFMEKIRVNSEQSRTLSQIRETLLPKLLSGKIRVDDVDQRLEVKDDGTS